MNARDEAMSIRNALTVDVEDYFQVSALSPYIDRRHWDDIPCRVERNVDRLLLRFDEHGAKATFFTLGWVAQRYPQLVRRIVDAGHELASHGHAHMRASEQSRADFDADIRRAKGILEDISGLPVRGYRAPSFSISAQNWWAFDCLREAGLPAGVVNLVTGPTATTYGPIMASPKVSCSPGVSIQPGSITLTLILCRASSAAIVKAI